MWVSSKSKVKKIDGSKASSVLESHGHFYSLALSQTLDVSVMLTCYGLSLLANVVSLHANTNTLSLNILKVLTIRLICLGFPCSFINPKLQVQRSLNWKKQPPVPGAEWLGYSKTTVTKRQKYLILCALPHLIDSLLFITYRQGTFSLKFRFH